MWQCHCPGCLGSWPEDPGWSSYLFPDDTSGALGSWSGVGTNPWASLHQAAYDVEELILWVHQGPGLHFFVGPTEMQRQCDGGKKVAQVYAQVQGCHRCR